VDYDPLKISYADLIAVYWGVAPLFESFSKQYTGIIYYTDEEQRTTALEALEKQEQKIGQKIYVEVIPLDRFYLAEDYHQKYYLKNSSTLYSDFLSFYGSESAVTNSTAAARINGYLGGNGTQDLLSKELNSYGLSEKGEKTLLDIAKKLFPLGGDRTCGILNIPGIL